MKASKTKAEHLLLTLIFLITTSCQSTKYIANQTSTTPSVTITDNDSLVLRIEAIDLSEDMSMLSTKNDELLVLIYEYNVDDVLAAPLFVKYMRLDQKNRIKQDTLPMNSTVSNSSLLFLLIEQDSEAPVEQIDPIIRVHHKALVDALEASDYNTLEKYLGDEDLLGVQQISTLENGRIDFNISGRYKLDKFKYRVGIQLMKNQIHE